MSHKKVSDSRIFGRLHRPLEIDHEIDDVGSSDTFIVADGACSASLVSSCQMFRRKACEWRRVNAFCNEFPMFAISKLVSKGPLRVPISQLPISFHLFPSDIHPPRGNFEAVPEKFLSCASWVPALSKTARPLPFAGVQVWPFCHPSWTKLLE